MEIIMLLAFLLTACGKKDVTISADIPKIPTIEYFIYDVNEKTTFKDLERDLGPAKMYGSGMSRLYYEAEDLVFMEGWGYLSGGVENINLLEVMDININYKCTLFYFGELETTDSYVEFFNKAGSDISDKGKKVDIRSLFDLNKEYTYKDIVNLYGEAQGITPDNRAYYYIDKGAILFPVNFTTDETVELERIEICLFEEKQTCLISYFEIEWFRGEADRKNKVLIFRNYKDNKTEKLKIYW